MGAYLLLAPLLWVVAVTVRDDLRHGRIFNRRLVQGALAGAACYAALALLDLAGAEPWARMPALPATGWPWLAAVGVDLVAGLAVGVLLWLLGVWAAGDAKLFALYAFLVPPVMFTRSYVAGFPALPVLVNTFALVFVLLAADLIRTGVPDVARLLADPRRRGAWLRDAPRQLVRAAPMLLTFTAMFAGIRALREASREGLSPLLDVGDFTMFLILFAVFRPLTGLLITRRGSIAFGVASAAALVYLAVRHGMAALPGFVVPSAYAVGLLLFARAYPRFGAATRTIRVGDLRPGMVLAPESLMRLRAREEAELAELGDAAPAEGDEPPGTTPRPTRLGSLPADGLDAEQVRYVHTRYDDDVRIAVARTIPLSPLLGAAALLSFVVGGAVTSLLRGG